jgi:hypothetical protein
MTPRARAAPLLKVHRPTLAAVLGLVLAATLLAWAITSNEPNTPPCQAHGTRPTLKIICHSTP